MEMSDFIAMRKIFRQQKIVTFSGPYGSEKMMDLWESFSGPGLN